MQRGNFRKPNKNYQRNPPGGNAQFPGGKRKSDPWAKPRKPGKPAAGESAGSATEPGTSTGEGPGEGGADSKG